MEICCRALAASDIVYHLGSRQPQCRGTARIRRAISSAVIAITMMLAAEIAASPREGSASDSAIRPSMPSPANIATGGSRPSLPVRDVLVGDGGLAVGRRPQVVPLVGYLLLGEAVGVAVGDAGVQVVASADETGDLANERALGM